VAPGNLDAHVVQRYLGHRSTEMTMRHTAILASTWAGMVYVAFVFDVFSRRLLGWRAATAMNHPAGPGLSGAGHLDAARKESATCPGWSLQHAHASRAAVNQVQASGQATKLMTPGSLR
jgi:hypothetical protein